MVPQNTDTLTPAFVNLDAGGCFFKLMVKYILASVVFQIERSVVAADVNCRILAFEAMGILAMYDRRVAFEKTILIKETLKIDQCLRVSFFKS